MGEGSPSPKHIMWTQCPELVGKFSINRTNGKLYWNTPIHVKLNWPTTVDLWYDVTEKRVGVAPGTRHVVLNEEDTFYIMAKEDLTYFGMVFPLANTKEYSCQSVSSNLPNGGILTVYYLDLDEPLGA